MPTALPSARPDDEPSRTPQGINRFGASGRFREQARFVPRPVRQVPRGAWPDDFPHER